jgi:tRNA A37 methylthiotransferase MiaB
VFWGEEHYDTAIEVLSRLRLAKLHFSIFQAREQTTEASPRQNNKHIPFQELAIKESYGELEAH